MTTMGNVPLSMHVAIYTLEATLFDGNALSLFAQGVQGGFEILPGHTSFLSVIVMGPLMIRGVSDQEIFFVSGGVVHVTEGRVIVLVDEAHQASNLDEVAAQKARQVAIDQLQNQHENVNYSEVIREIALAREQLRVIHMSKKDG